MMDVDKSAVAVYFFFCLPWEPLLGPMLNDRRDHLVDATHLRGPPRPPTPRSFPATIRVPRNTIRFRVAGAENKEPNGKRQIKTDSKNRSAQSEKLWIYLSTVSILSTYFVTTAFLIVLSHRLRPFEGCFSLLGTFFSSIFRFSLGLTRGWC